MKDNIGEICGILIEYLKTESGCIRVNMIQNDGYIGFSYELLNPEHSTEYIWEKVDTLLAGYDCAMLRCERVSEKDIRVSFKLKDVPNDAKNNV